MLLINPKKAMRVLEKREPVSAWMGGNSRLEDIQISPDGEKVAALFLDQNGESRLCVNGRIWDNSFERLWYPRFTPDNRLAALALDQGRWTLVVDDQVWDHRFDYAWNTRFSDKGGHVSVNIQNEGTYSLCLDDHPWPRSFPGIGHAALSPDGTHTAAVVQTKKISEGDIFAFQEGVFTLAVDGIPWNRQFVNAWDTAFSADNERAACAVRLNLYDYSVVVNGEAWPGRFDCVWGPRFHPKTLDVVAPVKTGQKWTMARNGEIFWKTRFSQLWKPEYSRDGSRLAAVVAPSFGTWSVAVDDRAWKIPRFEAITNLTFSPDGSRLAAVGMKNGRHTLIVDGKSYNRFCERVWPPVFSPDSRHIAARIETQGKYSIILDGKIWDRTCDKIWDPVFDDDGVALTIRAYDSGQYLKIKVPLSCF